MIKSFSMNQVSNLTVFKDSDYQEIIYKMEAIIKFLKTIDIHYLELHDLYYFQIPYSNILEYAEDIKKIITNIKNPPEYIW